MSGPSTHGDNAAENEIVELDRQDVGVPAQAAQREDAVDGIRIDPAAEKLSEVNDAPGSNPDSDGWSALNKGMENYEKDLLEKWRNELDNLLVFAGLFSAVVTAFTVESYKWLKEDSSDTSAKVLTTISTQLSSFMIASGFVNSTAPIPESIPFKPDTLSINVNILWISSLSLSLVAAFYTIAVQQWLRTFSIPSNLPPRTSVRFRQFRHNGLEHWRVPMILSLLPILIQIAVVLFFGGLAILLWSLNHTVATVLVLLFGLPLMLFLLSIAASLYSPNCPYRSPILPTIAILLNLCVHPFHIAFVWGRYRLALLSLSFLNLVDNYLWIPELTLNTRRRIFDASSRIINSWFNIRDNSPYHVNTLLGTGRFWDDRDRIPVAEKSHDLDISSLIRAPGVLTEEQMPTIIPCFAAFPVSTRMKTALSMAAQSLGRFSPADWLYHNDATFIHPHLLRAVDTDFSTRNKEHLFHSLPTPSETPLVNDLSFTDDADSSFSDTSISDWVSTDATVTPILLFLQTALSVEQPPDIGMRTIFSQRVLQFCCGQQLNTTLFENQGRLPPSILYNCCVKKWYTPDHTERQMLIEWTLDFLEEAIDQAYSHSQAVETALAASACVLCTVLQDDLNRGLEVDELTLIHIWKLVTELTTYMSSSQAIIYDIVKARRPHQKLSIVAETILTIARLFPNLEDIRTDNLTLRDKFLADASALREALQEHSVVVLNLKTLWKSGSSQ